jgi:hypothetical protein
MPGQDYFSDAAPAPAPEAAAPKAEAEPKEGDGDSQTAVLPTAVLGGKEWKPGEEIVLQIVQVNEDGAVVKYAPEKGETEEEPKEEAAPAPAPGGAPGGGGMNSMYE